MYLIYPLKLHEEYETDQIEFVVRFNWFKVKSAINVHVIKVPFVFFDDYQGKTTLLREIVESIMADYYAAINRI